MSAPAVSIDGVRRLFDRAVALDDVSLDIAEGTAHALLGPNGAGKSTVLRVASTLLRPNSGRVRTLSFDRSSDGLTIRRRIGLLSHESFLYGDLSIDENLKFYARVYGLPNIAERIEAIAVELDLIGWRHRPVRNLSRGTVQRAALARVLLA